MEWPEDWLPLSIAAKELLPVVMATMVWGPNWQGHHVRCLSDNEVVVFVINRCSVRSPELMRLIRCLFFVEASFNFKLSATHLPGRLNTAADCLSRNRMSEFFNLFPQALVTPVMVPPEVSRILLDRSLDWPSPSWNHLLRPSSRKL